MSMVRELVDLAEECFRQADREKSSSTADALRETGLGHLEAAYQTWQEWREPRTQRFS